jgi:acyl carrier protein
VRAPPPGRCRGGRPGYNPTSDFIRRPHRPAGDGGQPPTAPEERSVSDEQIRQRVIDIVCEHLAVNKDQVTDNTSFIEDIGADSLDIVELVMELEEEFDIQIPDDQAEKIKTVGEAVEYIKVAVKNKGADGGAKA